ncbi:REP-associated tyrosine transposase [Arhodomonas sp. AD133]|uniref:REP-associated tyrosine transposase n=1 Tax=Arhodomonas sp. AD133 TaxID=3415009 RepID=UPI003EBEE294
MPEYRRNRAPGGTYFFTATLANRRSDLLTRHVALLREAFRTTQRELPFRCDAIAVLPEHLHCIWTLPDGDADYPRRWQRLKARFSRALTREYDNAGNRRRRGERGIWQRRYWEHTIGDENDYRRHMDYIHFNPVKHGLVAHPAQWPYSSLHRYVAAGWHPQEWAGSEVEDLPAGE